MLKLKYISFYVNYLKCLQDIFCSFFTYACDVCMLKEIFEFFIYCFILATNSFNI